MTKKLLIFALAVTLAGVANAQVVWTYSGGSTTDATIWDDATNWTAPSGNTYTTPSEQYVNAVEEDDRSFINDDITQIAITGYTVNKTQIGGLNNQDDLYMGGNNTALILDNATLNVGDDMKTGRDDKTTTANTSITLQNSSALSCDQFYTASASSSACSLNILSASTLTTNNIRFGYGGSETITLDGVGSVMEAVNSVQIGYSGYEYGNTNTITVNVTDGAKIVTGNSTGLRVGQGEYSKVNMTVTGTTANPCLIDTSVDEDTGSETYGSAIGNLRVAEGANSVATLTLENCTSTSSTVTVGSGSLSNGTLTLNSGTTLNAGVADYRNGEDLYVGDDGGTGVMTIKSGASVYVADDVYLGDNTTSHGTITVNAGGSIDCDSSLKVADEGTGIVHIYGTTDFSSDAFVGNHVSSTGTLNIYDGAVVNVGGVLKTNDSAESSSGSINMTGGELNIDEALVIARKGADGSEGIFTMSGGTVNIGLDAGEEDDDDLILGYYISDADATVNINGGTMIIADAIRMGGPAEDMLGSDLGQLRINIDGGTLQAEDYIDEGTITDHLITLSSGYLRISNVSVSETEMQDLITAGDIACPNGSSISTDGSYTVLTCLGDLIPGDTNGDNIVDDTDATKLATNWGSAVTPGNYSDGDFNNDGVVDAIDASIMAANWGNHTGTESGSVPEPAFLSLVFGALLFTCIRRKR